LKINRKTYAHWESNVTDVKASYIPKLVEIFEVEISDFFNLASNFHIEQQFHNSTINTVILISIEKEAIDKMIDALKL